MSVTGTTNFGITMIGKLLPVDLVRLFFGRTLSVTCKVYLRCILHAVLRLLEA